MTKRFTLKYEKIGKYFSIGIVDHETKEPFDDTTYEFNQCSFNDSKDEMEDLCLLLNELHEEKEEMQKKMNRLYNYFEDFFSEEMGNDDFAEQWEFVADDEKWD